jgi:hypothetical protein
MPFATTFGGIEIVLPPWNTSSLMVLPPQDTPNFATASKTLRRQYECPKNYCLEFDAMLLSQDLMRVMTDYIVATLNRPLVAP